MEIECCYRNLVILKGCNETFSCIVIVLIKWLVNNPAIVER